MPAPTPTVTTVLVVTMHNGVVHRLPGIYNTVDGQLVSQVDELRRAIDKRQEWISFTGLPNQFRVKQIACVHYEQK